jgi:hypothetical protein
LQVSGYEAAFSTAAFTLWLQQANLQAPNSLLAAALQLLLAFVTNCGRPEAVQLYTCNISDVLERLCGFCTPEVLGLTEKVYSQLCLLSSQLRDEVMQDSNMTALTGIVKGAAAAAGARPAAAECSSDLAAAASSMTDATVLVIEPAAAAAAGTSGCSLKLALAALSRLAAAVDAAAGADIIRFTGPVVQPCSAAAAALGGSSTAAASIRPPAATAAGAVEVMRHVAAVVGDGSSCGLAAVVALMVGGQQGLLVREAAGQVGLVDVHDLALHACMHACSADPICVTV